MHPITPRAQCRKLPMVVEDRTTWVADVEDRTILCACDEIFSGNIASSFQPPDYMSWRQRLRAVDDLPAYHLEMPVNMTSMTDDLDVFQIVVAVVAIDMMSRQHEDSGLRTPNAPRSNLLCDNWVGSADTPISCSVVIRPDGVAITAQRLCFLLASPRTEMVSVFGNLQFAWSNFVLLSTLMTFYRNPVSSGGMATFIGAEPLWLLSAARSNLTKKPVATMSAQDLFGFSSLAALFHEIQVHYHHHPCSNSSKDGDVIPALHCKTLVDMKGIEPSF